MAKKGKRTIKLKSKKKRWYPILAPNHLGKKDLGDSYLGEPEEAIGRTIKVNLMQVTGDVKSQSAEVKFMVTDFKDGSFNTRITEYNYSPSSIKRVVRRRKTRVDDSSIMKTKDGRKVRIKPFLLTTNKVSRAVECNLRATLKKELEKLVNKSDYEELFNSIINYKIQRKLRDILTKIYPVKALEIRVLKEVVEEERYQKEDEKKNIKEEKPVEEEKEEPKEVKKKTEKKETKKIEKKEEKPKKEKKKKAEKNSVKKTAKKK